VVLPSDADDVESIRALAAGGPLALAATAATVARGSGAPAWGGFEVTGKEMVHAVTASWLPCLTSSQRLRLFDDVLTAMPALTAVRVLVPALAPSRTAAGRDLDTRGRLAVATEAARLLAAALARGLAADLISTVPAGKVPGDIGGSSGRGGVNSGDDGGGRDSMDTDALEGCQLLLSAADRLELPAGSHRAAVALRPSALARTVADQLLVAAAAAAGNGGGGGGGGGGEDSRRLALAAFVLGRLCRRGNADEAAGAIMAALLADNSNSKSTQSYGGDGVGGGDRSGDEDGGAWVGALIAAVSDAHAVEKLAASLLRAAASCAPLSNTNPTLTWRISERRLRACFTVRFWTCAATRHALSDKLLLRHPGPRAVLPALLRLTLVSPPPVPPTPASTSASDETKADTATAEQSTAGGDSIAGRKPVEETVERHRATTTAALVDAWSDPELIRAGGAALQGHVAAVTAAALGALPPSTWQRATGGVCAAALMRGISARLDSPSPRARRHGQKVAVALAKAVDPARPLSFREDEDFGEDEGEDAAGWSEDEAEWEQDASALSEAAVVAATAAEASAAAEREVEATAVLSGGEVVVAILDRNRTAADMSADVGILSDSGSNDTAAVDGIGGYPKPSSVKPEP